MYAGSWLQRCIPYFPSESESFEKCLTCELIFCPDNVNSSIMFVRKRMTPDNAYFFPAKLIESFKPTFHSKCQTRTSRRRIQLYSPKKLYKIHAKRGNIWPRTVIWIAASELVLEVPILWYRRTVKIRRTSLNILTPLAPNPRLIRYFTT